MREYDRITALSHPGVDEVIDFRQPYGEKKRMKCMKCHRRPCICEGGNKKEDLKDGENDMKIREYDVDGLPGVSVYIPLKSKEEMVGTKNTNQRPSVLPLKKKKEIIEDTTVGYSGSILLLFLIVFGIWLLIYLVDMERNL